MPERSISAVGSPIRGRPNSEVATPAIARHFHRGERRALQKSLRVAALCVAAATLPMLAAVIAFAEPLLGLFGPGFEGYGSLLAALACGIALNALFGPTAPLLMMIGRTGTLLRILAASQAAALALQLSLAPVWGVWGIAAGAVAGVALRNVAAWRACRRAAGVDPAATCLLPPLRAALSRGRAEGAS